MADIVLITTFDVDEQGKKHLIVSHGVDQVTLKNVVLPCEHPSELGGVFCEELGEWVLRDEPAKAAEPARKKIGFRARP